MPFQSGEQQQLSFQLQIGMQGALTESVQSPESPAPAHDTEGEAWWEVLWSQPCPALSLASWFPLSSTSALMKCCF